MSEHSQPAPRAVHAIHEALLLLRDMRDSTVESDAQQLAELLAPVALDVAVLQQTIEALEADMRGLRDSALAAHREVTRLREANEALNEALHLANEDRVAMQKDRERVSDTFFRILGEASEGYRRVNGLPVASDREPTIESTLHEETRLVASGA